MNTNAIRQTLGRLAYRAVMPLRRRRLRNRRVSIISNDCFSSFMYQYYRTEFNSPFVGLFIMPDDYLDLLAQPDLLHAPMQMATAADSRFRDRLAHLPSYPLGILPGGREIHFLHYRDADQALAKWTRRLRRLDMTNCIVKFSENNGCTPAHLRRFDALPYREKVAFTCRRYPDLPSTLYLPEFAGQPELGRYWKLADLHYNLRRHADALLPR